MGIGKIRGSRLCTSSACREGEVLARTRHASMRKALRVERLIA
jgi:hypothetical protein